MASRRIFGKAGAPYLRVVRGRDPRMSALELRQSRAGRRNSCEALPVADPNLPAHELPNTCDWLQTNLAGSPGTRDCAD